MLSPTSPKLIAYVGNITLTLNYTGLIAPIVKAMQEIAAISGTFETNLVAWLGSASNGIGDFFAKNIHGDTVAATQQLCIGQTCVSEAQLKTLLAQSAQGSGNSSANTPAASSTAPAISTTPVLSITGTNPATVNVGASYADWGATITAPTADKNLGIVTLVDGATTTQVIIDTSKPGTHTIVYSVTDQAGNVGTATRTVNVVDPFAGALASSTPASTSTSTAMTSSTQN